MAKYGRLPYFNAELVMETEKGGRFCSRMATSVDVG